MANRDIVTRGGKGSDLDATDHDQNHKSFAGTVEEQTGTTYTVIYTDQNKTIELNNASMVCTLTAIATIHGQIDTDNFKVTLVNTNSTAATVNRSSTDTFIGGATSITLQQGESITLQTDTTGAIWNIKSNYVPFKGCFITLDTNQSISNNTQTAIIFDTGNATEVYDYGGFHDLATNPTRLTIPTGVSKVRITAQGYFDTLAGITNAGQLNLSLRIDGSATINGTSIADTYYMDSIGAAQINRLNFISPILEVSAASYIELYCYQTTGAALNMSAGATWVALEVIE